MKLPALLFFILVTPLTIFLSTLLYNGLTSTDIKSQLSKSQTYTALSDFIQNTSPDEDESEQIVRIVKKRLTPEYLQDKTETSIDDSFTYITGESTTPPVLSLKELKTDIIDQNPEILTEITHMSEQMETTRETMEATQENDSVVVATPEAEFLTTLIKNDFSLPFGDKLHSLRQIVQLLKLVVPGLILLVIGSLVVLILTNQTTHGRLKWLGLAFVGVGIVGYGMVLGTASIITIVVRLLEGNTNEIATVFSPFLIGIVTDIVTTYAGYQVMANYAFLLTGGICFLGMKIMKENNVLIPKPTGQKKK